MIVRTLVTIALMIGAVVPAAAQPQDKGQRKCITTLNSDGTKVALQQGVEAFKCLRDAGLGKIEGTLADCSTLDPKGKIAKKRQKTVDDEATHCTPEPTFGYTDAATVNDAGVAAALGIPADVFGADLDSAIISCDENKSGCLCQRKVAKDVQARLITKLKTFSTCKKKLLKSGAESAADLEDCIDDPGTPGSIAADSNEKLAKGLGRIGKSIDAKCDAKDATLGSFPGACDGFSGMPLAVCVDARVNCRLCEMLNAADGLAVNCDLFDDGDLNGSCASGSGLSEADLAALDGFREVRAGVDPPCDYRESPTNPDPPCTEATGRKLPPLRWSPTLADIQASFVNFCPTSPNRNLPPGVGQNFFLSFSTDFTTKAELMAEAIDFWLANGRAGYDPVTGACVLGCEVYKQMVAQEAVEVGCGVGPLSCPRARIVACAFSEILSAGPAYPPLLD